MQVAAAVGVQAVEEALPDAVVDEHELAPGAALQDPDADGLQQGFVDLAVEDVPGELGAEAGADDGGRGEDLAGLWAEAVDALEDEVDDVVGEIEVLEGVRVQDPGAPCGADGPGLEGGTDELGDGERASVGADRDLLHQPLVDGAAAQVGGHEVRDLGPVEGAEGEVVHVAEAVAEGRAEVVVGDLRASGGHQEEGAPREALGEAAQDAEGGLVEPVEVL